MDRLPTGSEHKFSLDLRLGPDERMFSRLSTEIANKSARDVVQALDGFSLDILFLPRGSEITRGFIAVKVNSCLDKTLMIPPQKLGDWPLITSPLWLKPADQPGEIK